MPAPTISPLPTPPSRSTDPANFAIEADAFVAALPTFGTQANAQAVYLDALAIDVDADAVAAATSAANAEGFADDAAASASGAAAAADVYTWVSGTTYAIGDCVFSPLNFQTYRRKTSGAGATDPSLDIANWVAISGSGGGGKIIAVATGALSNGTKVVLNSDGTVSAVSKTITALNPPTSSALFQSSLGQPVLNNIEVAYDKKRKVVFVATQNSSTVQVFTGQVIDNTIIFDLTLAVGYTTLTRSIGLVYDHRTEQVVLAYSSSIDTFGYIVVGKVWYNAGIMRYDIAYGTEIVFNSGAGTGHIALAVNPDNSTVLIGYQNSTPLAVKVGTLGFKTMTLGTAATVISSGQGTGLCYIGNNNFAVTYRSLTGTTGLTAAVVSISGTTATVNTAINLSGASSIHPALCACDISTQRLVTTYVNITGDTGLACVASISGTTLTAGNSVTVVANSANQRVGVSFNPDTGRFVFAYINNADTSRLYTVSGLITGTSIALGTAGVVNSATTSGAVPSSIFRNDVGDTIVFSTTATATLVSAFVASATITANLTTDNFIGISDGAYTNGANATIQVISSVDDAQVGLTAGRRYFVSEDGSLKLQSGDWEPVVYAGTAVNSTSLLIKG